MRKLTAVSLTIAHAAIAQAREPGGQADGQSRPVPLAEGAALHAVLVTATRSPRPVAAIPGTVMVIGPDRIREQL